MKYLLYFLIPLMGINLSAEELKLDINSYIKIVRENNPDLKYKKFDPLIKQTIYEEEYFNRTSGYGGNLYANYEQNFTKVTNQSETKTLTYGWKKKFVTGGTTFNYFNSHLQTPNNTGEKNWLTKVNFSVTQPILRGGFWDHNNQRNIDLKKSEYLISESTYNIELINYMQSALLVYWQYQINRELIELQQEILRDAKELLAFNRKRVQIGVVTRSEILSSQAEVLNSENDLATSKAGLKKLNETLKYFMGKSEELNLNIVFEDQLKIKRRKFDVDKSIELALKNRQEFVSFAHRRELNNNSLAIAKHYAYFPQLDTTVTYSLVGNGNELGKSFSSIGDNIGTLAGSDLNVSVNFSVETDAPSYYLATQRIDQNIQQLDLEEKKFIQEVKNEIREKIREIENGYDKVKTLEKVLALHTERYQIGKKDYLIGKLDLNQFVQNRQAILQAKINFLSSKLAYWESYLNLKLSEGTLLEAFSIEKFELPSLED